MSNVKAATIATLDEAATLLQQGGLVAFATETVYGLGANALDGVAVARIFEAKGRPAFNPLIVHVANLEDAERLAVFSDAAYSVADRFWPGPLTMILPRRADCPVSTLATAGLPTIAIRIPGHAVARDIIARAGVPVAAPSANRSGRLSPTAAIHVAQDLGDAVDLIVAGGASAVGLESTVLDLSGNRPVVLRPGAVLAEDIAACLEMPVEYDLGDHDAPKSPGQLLRHYAPSIPIRLNAARVEEGEAVLAFGPDPFLKRRVADNAYRNLSERGDLYEAAANLFSHLHALDDAQFKAIAVSGIPETGLGIAINDRLRRAANSV